MIRYISVLFIISLALSQDIIQEENKDDFTFFESIIGDDISNLELMLIANINRSKILEKYLQLSVISESLDLDAPEYNRFILRNNSGMYLIPIPIRYSTSLFPNKDWINATKWLLTNNETYSIGFFNSSLDKFTYHNSRKGFVDTDNYFKDPWNQRSIDDYIIYMHKPPTMTDVHSLEVDTIYDRNRN